jgi:predicted nucleic acid-binding protein
MARYFLDSSALVKHYHRESGSPAVERLFNERGNKLFVSSLALVEVHSAFARLVREGAITEEDFARVIARMESEISARILTVSAVTTRRLDAAAAILRNYGPTNNIRTLDAIQLANAQALHARGRIAAFVAADKKLMASAPAACGLTTLDVS